MADLEPQSSNDFMREKIKERPINKKKLLRRTITTAAMAVVFGLIACLTFLGLQPIVNDWLHPENKASLTDDYTSDYEGTYVQGNSTNKENTNTSSGDPLDDYQDNLFMSGGIDDVVNNYRSLNAFTKELVPCMVTVTGNNDSDTDWISTSKSSSGVIFDKIEQDSGQRKIITNYIILVDYSALEKTKDLKVVFCNGSSAEAVLVGVDYVTNLAVVSADVRKLSSELLSKTVKIATIGTSTLNNIEGTPVIALGNPMGVTKSRGYGMITAGQGFWSAADQNYRLLLTDVEGSEKGSGFLFDLNGKVIGAITSHKADEGMENMITAYGISDLVDRIDLLKNGKEIPYCGVSGQDIPAYIQTERGTPQGMYVTSVASNSPARRAGIQQGDIITNFDFQIITNVSDFAHFLMSKEPNNTVRIVLKRQNAEGYEDITVDVDLGVSKK